MEFDKNKTYYIFNHIKYIDDQLGTYKSGREKRRERRKQLRKLK